MRTWAHEVRKILDCLNGSWEILVNILNTFGVNLWVSLYRRNLGIACGPFSGPSRATFGLRATSLTWLPYTVRRPHTYIPRPNTVYLKTSVVIGENPRVRGRPETGSPTRRSVDTEVRAQPVPRVNLALWSRMTGVKLQPSLFKLGKVCYQPTYNAK